MPDQGFLLSRLSFIFIFFISFFPLLRILKKEKPDLVHLITIKPYLYGGIASRLLGVPSVVSAVSGLGTLFVHKILKVNV